MSNFRIHWLLSGLRKESFSLRHHVELRNDILTQLKAECRCKDVVEAMEIDKLNPRRMCIICGHEEEWLNGYQKLRASRIIHRISGNARQEFYLLRDFLTRDEWLRKHKVEFTY